MTEVSDERRRQLIEDAREQAALLHTWDWVTLAKVLLDGEDARNEVVSLREANEKLERERDGAEAIAKEFVLEAAAIRSRVATLEVALRDCEKEATAWQEEQESNAYNTASLEGTIENLEQMGERYTSAINRAVSAALSASGAGSAGDEAAWPNPGAKPAATPALPDSRRALVVEACRATLEWASDDNVGRLRRDWGMHTARAIADRVLDAASAPPESEQRGSE